MAYSTSTLAQGCFGKVYKEKYNDTWAAVKKVPHHLINKKDLERECEVYNKANHANIVKLLGNITLKDGKWIIPLEFIFGEDLETTIFKVSRSKIKLTPPNKGTIIIGMCEGLLHLHSKDIVHQDLKPENIMVEHKTNRAIIIDLGLAKFFRRGLSSAIDMGNEAYSAPEVLQGSSQRDQRSDVWAMGKIIAELCARVRLYTPSVCPAKIKETLKDQPFCSAVCRMVETDPSLRASMTGVISEIRASAADIVAQSGYLQLPSSHSNTRSRSLSPMPRGSSPVRRAHSPYYTDLTPVNRDPSPGNRAHSPYYTDPTPVNTDPSPMTRGRSPVRRAHSPYYTDPTPVNRDPSPMTRGRSPVRWAHSPYYTDPTPVNRYPSPMNRAHSPYYTDPTPVNRAYSPHNTDPSAMNRASSSSTRHLSPQYRSSSPPKWKHSSTPEMKVVISEAPTCPSSSSQGTEDRKQHLASTGGGDIMQDFTKMKMYEEAAKDLPCNLPTTGRIVVQRFEEKNGEVESWEQKEVVTRDGKIVKYDDVRFNSK